MATMRRICWPNPDSVCLEGGCIYCNDKPFRTYVEIQDYAEKVNLISSYNYGLSRNWHGKESK